MIHFVNERLRCRFGDIAINFRFPFVISRVVLWLLRIDPGKNKPWN